MKEVRSRVQEDIASAARELHGPGTLSDERIHRARKAIKRARAGLRLLRDGVGKRAYDAENQRLRDAAQPLSPVRDLCAMGERLDALIADESDAGRRAAVRRLRDAMSEEHDAALRALQRKPQRAAIVAALEESWRRIGAWRLPDDPSPMVEAGLVRTYRSCRRAVKRSEARPSDQRLHEARKQAKYLGNALLLLEPEAHKRVRRLVQRSEAVTERLGIDHDLAVLGERLGGQDEALQAQLVRRRKRLERKALQEARRLVRAKPAKFAAKLQGLRRPAAAVPS